MKFSITRSIFTLLLLTLGCSSKYTGYKQRNYDTINKIYERTVYPKNLAFIANGSASVPAGLFNDKATGRISPVANFSGFDDSTEYFFGLAPIPRPPTYTAFTRAQIVEFTSGCETTAASVVYFTNSVVNPNATNNGQYVTTLKQIAFWTFDDQGLVLKYDAWIPNLRLYSSVVSGRGMTNVDPPPPEAQSATIQTLCGTTQTLCQGNNTQYTSVDDCVKTLTAKPFGDGDNFWSDSIHCPHLGETGGGKCVDVEYNEGYFDDQALFGEEEGQNFMCPD
ncbi:MAG: hypothetical protein Q9222_002194 [Ikaeria aurantiellina]